MAMITAVTARPAAPTTRIASARVQAFRPVRAAPLTGLPARHRVIVKAEDVGSYIALADAGNVCCCSSFGM